MKLDGQRQSTNVDDIRKQPRKKRTGTAAFPASEGLDPGEVVSRNSTISKKKSDPTPATNASLQKKSGYTSMVDAATNIAMERVKRESNQASIDADLDKAFSKENKGLAGGQKPIEATAPKQLNEIWTPRPHKM